MYQIQESLPFDELPYEKCKKSGPQYLTDAELLAVLLRTGTSGMNVLELAHRIVGYHNGGLHNLYYMTTQELQEIPGVGPVKAMQLKCMGEISRRIATSARLTQVELSDAGSVAGYFMEQMRYDEREKLILCMFDSKCHLLGHEVLSVGTVNSSLVSPREVFLTAMKHRAVYIILLHNHPSGDVKPSKADREVTEAVYKCGELLGIRLADHIIIGDCCYYSFCEHNQI